jgi:pimeloyl-ACP methyl ester carboxylesterase
VEQLWREEAVYTDAEDGVLLHGMFTVPAAQTAPTVVFVHGYMVSANLPFTSQIARAFAARGHAFLAANTRGHDLATWLFRRDGQAMIGGAWYERFDESPHDLGAWINFAHARRPGPLILIGHSFGAQKAVHYQASRADPRVGAVVVASATVRRYARQDPERERLAANLVEEGRGLELLPWTDVDGLLHTTSAQTYHSWRGRTLDVFGVETAEPSIANIRSAVLAICGSKDISTPEEKEDLALVGRNARSAEQHRMEIVDGGDHGYVGVEDVFADRVSRWSRTVPLLQGQD